MKQFKIILTALFALAVFIVNGQDKKPNLNPDEIDTFMEKVMEDWNIPGMGIGIVHKDELIYQKGYGYRDYGNKIPFTSQTLVQIASNTKLFTVIAAGMLVEEGILTWDEPIKKAVPEIEFFNDHLNNNVTLRDMLGHLTGISRHDLIWFQSDFTRKEIFDRLKYLEPSAPLRTKFIYNNIMYTAVGYIIELKSGMTWEDFVTERILKPLEMNQTLFSIEKMQQTRDYGVPYNEKSDTTLLYKVELKTDGHAVGPAGAIISNIDDISKWVITILNDGKYKNRQVIPSSVLKETLEPVFAFRNRSVELHGWKETLNVQAALGRFTEVYRGNFLTNHGGSMPGFQTQISMLPHDSIGIIVFGLGDQSRRAVDFVTDNLIEHLLGLDQTDWNSRYLTFRDINRQTFISGRTREDHDRVDNTTPTHPVSDYTGFFTNPMYGDFTTYLRNDTLFFNFRNTEVPLSHYHFNRFDSDFDEDFGKWSLNFLINPQGEIGSFVVSLDQKQAEFIRKPDPALSTIEVLSQYIGFFGDETFETEVRIVGGKLLFGSTELVPHKKHVFKVKDFDNRLVEFVAQDNKVTAIQLKNEYGVFEFKKLR
ncbi:MAG: serine hydrolase [Bacteroidales bacterium]